MSAQTEDRRSQVPFYRFPDDREQQEEALAANPMLKRFVWSRTALAGDRHRPYYHYVNPEGTLNDPNGLCFWNGLWHLFYQGYPPEDPRQHWGHCVSEDLIHWRDLPYAIYPDPEECCFSGAALVEKDRVIAIYHGTKVGNMVATSSDPLLLNWEKLTGQAVIPMTAPDGGELPYRVFDPCIWRKGDFYYSLSGGTLPHPTNGVRTRANFLLRSRDMETWEYLHPFIEGDTMTKLGDDGACPYFWPIGQGDRERHMLLFYSHMSGGQALLGDYDKDRDKFVVTSLHEANFGASGPGGVHAPSATPDGEGGVIVIYNMNPGRVRRGWDQIMTLPRRLTLREDEGRVRDQIAVEPAGDLASLRSAEVALADVALPANEEVVLDGVSGDALEMEMEIADGDASVIELNVLRSPGAEEYTRFAFYRSRGFRNWARYGGWEPAGLRAATDSIAVLDNGRSSILDDVSARPPEQAPVYLAPDEPLQLRVFVDRSVVEVFVNGRQCVALRCYPGRLDSTGVSLRAGGSPARVTRLRAWRMANLFAR